MKFKCTMKDAPKHVYTFLIPGISRKNCEILLEINEEKTIPIKHFISLVKLKDKPT